jgi:hypothetical protein
LRDFDGGNWFLAWLRGRSGGAVIGQVKVSLGWRFDEDSKMHSAVIQIQKLRRF